MLCLTRLVIRVIACAFVAFFTGNPQACAQQIQFNRLPIFQDATWLVTAMTQDPEGYMWFGTKRTGLYRYDGYDIVPYKNQVSNTNSLSYDAVESLYADKDGIIWIGTFGKGLDRFDPATGRFTHFRSSPADAGSLANDTVICITEDSRHNLWLGTYGGVSRLDKKTGKIISYKHNENDNTSLSCNQVRAVYQDREGTIWIGTGSGFYENDSCSRAGLNRLDSRTGKFTHYFHDKNDPTTLTDNRVRAIYEDRKGVFYVGTAGDGLHIMDRNTGKFTRLLYDPKHPERLSRPPLRHNLGIADDHITFINEDATGALWIGSFNGVNRYDPVTKKVQYFPSLSDSSSPTPDNVAWMTFTSNDGVFWLSTIGQGNIYHADPFLKKVSHYDVGDQVNCIYKEAPGTLWIGTQFSGLIKKDRSNNSQKSFPFPGITAIRPAGNNKLWIGTIAGLFLFDTKTERSGLADPKIPGESANENIVSSLFVNKKGDLWIGSTRGLTYFNSKEKNFSHFMHTPHDSNSIADLPLTSVLEDNAGRVWMGSQTDRGISTYDQHSKKFKHYLEGRGITGTILQDASGTIWAGTHDGLYRYDTVAANFIPFREAAAGASLNYILNLLEDEDQNLWVVTGKELLRINKKRNEIIHFGINEGVKPNTGYGGTNVGAGDHGIFYGDQTGYYDFNPGALTVNRRPPQILLTDFAIKDQDTIGDLHQRLLTNDDPIKLRHNENVFSFYAVPVHYSNPPDNKLMYMLDNFDNNWREAAPGQKLYYFNVSPGKYTLRIKAANGNGIWTQKNIAIVVKAPWWRKWWAIATWVVLLAGMVWLFIEYRSRSLVKEKHLLEQKVNLRTQEVVAQKEEISNQRDQLREALEGLQNTQAQLVQREKMASLGELTAGIAHEIQNPLNFVKNFSEVNMDLLKEIHEAMNNGDTAETQELFNYLEENTGKVLEHGMRADSIIKGMLHHFRSSSHTAELTDVNDLVDECLRLTYHGLRAKDKSFNAVFNTDYAENLPQINIIRQDVGRVFLNIFTNAFYAVSEKKKLLNDTAYDATVSISTKQLNDNIEIVIKDNGNGMPQSVVDKIFQPFFTTKPTGQGTGLGLSLSYDIVTAHGGEIKVETKEGEGSAFIIRLPYN